jgi:hypothetical protein
MFTVACMILKYKKQKLFWFFVESTKDKKTRRTQIVLLYERNWMVEKAIEKYRQICQYLIGKNVKIKTPLNKNGCYSFGTMHVSFKLKQ